jgi:hypothetical protein
MTAQLEHMIAAQPDVIAGLAGSAAARDAAERIGGARRVWLVGTGTSLHAAELGAAEFARHGVDARAIADRARRGLARGRAHAGGRGLLDQIPMTVRLQRLALRFARLRGQNADVAITGAWADPELWPS